MTACKSKIIYKNYSSDNRIEVQDNRVNRSLYFSETILQSSMEKSQPHRLILSYTRYMMLPLLIAIPEKLLILGVGGGSFIRFFDHYFPKTTIDAIDSCQETLKIARHYFHLPQTSKIMIHNSCGSEFLSDTDEQYDLILIDTFDLKGMARKIYNPVILELCRKKLTDTGILCCNLWSNNRSFLAEVKEILDQHGNQTLYIPVPDKGNVISISTNQTLSWNHLHPKNRNLINLAEKLEIDFAEMVKIARRANMPLWQRACDHFF